MNATFQQLAKVANFPISEKFPTFAKTRYPQAYHEGESGKSHTDRDRHADAGLAGCSPSPPPSRIQHLLRDVAGMRPMRRSDARTQSGRRQLPSDFRHVGPGRSIAYRTDSAYRSRHFRDCLLPYIRRSGRFGPATFLSAFHGALRLAWQRAFALVTGSSRFPGLTRLFPFQENGLFIRR